MGSPDGYVKVYIDGVEVEVPPTATILDAAKQAGVDIPTLCYHPHIDPTGACRICVVEVEGNGEPVAACNTFVADGMKVRTSSPELEEIRRQNLKLILINHPLDCPVCDKAGECDLQRVVWRLGVTEDELSIDPIDMVIDRASPLIARYDTRCVRCGRCVSVCEQVRGVGALEFYDTGYESRIRPKTGEILDCEFCGACVEVCPVGALLSILFLHKERVWNLERTPSTCGQCGAQCAILCESKGGLIYRVQPDEDRHRYKGQLCHRGYFGYDYPHHPERLLAPHKRVGSKQQPLSLHQATDELAEQIRQEKERHGPESMGFLISERLSNEEILSVCELAKKLGVERVGSLADFGPSAAFADAYRPYMTATFDDVAEADLLLVAGDLEYEMPSVALRVIEADRNDAHVVRVSYRRGKLSRFARENYQVLPGDETAFLWAVARALAEIVPARVDVANPNAVEELKSHALSEWAQPLGIDESKLTALAGRIAGSERLVLVLGRNLLYGSDAPQAISAASLILALSGKAGADGSGVLLSVDRANLRGVLEFTKGFESPWEALEAGSLRALVSFEADPILDFPSGHLFASKLESLELLASTAVFEGPLSASSKLVIPAKVVAEKSGSVLSADGYLVEFSSALSGPAQALSTFDMANEIALRVLGEPVFESLDAAKAAVRRAVAGVELKPSKLELAAPKLPRGSLDGSVVLAVGPELFHAGRFTPYSTGPTTLVPSPYIAVSEALAQRLGIAPAQKVTLSSGGASASAQVKIYPDLADGAVFVPEGFSEPPFYLMLKDSFFSVVSISRE